MPPRMLLLALPATLAVAGCGGGSSTGSSPAASSSQVAPPPVVTPASGFPFTFQGDGQGTSPPFAVGTAGTYTVTFHLSCPAAQAPCSPSIALTTGAGSRTIVSDVTLQANQAKDGTAPVDLTAGDWRFVEGGNSQWSVTVAKG